MTNFYEDYSFSPEDFEIISNLLGETMQNLMDYITPLNDLRINRQLEDFRIIPVQYLDISSALYDVGGIFNSEELKAWETADKNSKVDMLNSKGKYIRLVADRGFPSESGDMPEQYDIINFRLYDPNGVRLVHNTDYIYKNNCIYLLDYASWDIRNGQYFKLEDIAIDFNTTTDMLGKNLELKHRPTKMSKSEFNEIMRILTIAMLKGGTVAGAMDGLTELNNGSSDGIKIVDKLRDTYSVKSKWKKLPGPNDYSPFDFVIYYPAYFSEYKVELLKCYFDKVKHAYTKYTELAYDYHEEIYNGLLADDWWDSILRPFIDTKGYAAVEGADKILYHVVADTYYMRDENDNIILEAHLETDLDPIPVMSIGENNIPVTKETVQKAILESYFEDRFQQLLESVPDSYKDISSISNQEAESSRFAINQALTNDWYSRTGYNMILS